MLTKALQRTDLQWVSSHRSKLRGAVGIDVGLTRRLVQKLPAQGMKEALESVLVGDMVVRHVTKHWQPHDGRCPCELAEETVQHVFWECPRYAGHRQSCEQGLGGRLPPCLAQLGAPMQLPALAA